ncbi:hypothetical protein C8N35_102378 [Breoghania corrubedonensis]|uniref:Uncharacterized protein n=1 Tax=Breoghania corrubedonensis TaxID=665038 RepID=A0A2T5VD31_9HYPH|nr:hypothetical protein [Breoghania corrubedonensis]PTW61663.1 hypothetical protein C8N35_102378 [Breoghania corrubedonensis]
MKSRSIRLALHVFATLLLVAAVVTGTWQQSHVLRQQTNELPSAPQERIVARVETTARSVQTGQTGGTGTDRPCPRLLHLDATLSPAPSGAARANRVIALEMAALLAPEEYTLGVATPPPRA